MVEAEAKSSRARKRRMERRQKDGKKPRVEEEWSDPREEGSDSDASGPPTTLSKDALALIPGVKKQARYVPAVNMSKDELTLWRKEARRVRNRESAAASRQKTQKRIVELEGVVGELNAKYQAALRRIAELEAANSSSAWKPVPLHSDESPVMTPHESPVMTPHPVSPPLSPRESFSLDSTKATTTDLPQNELYPTTFMISRPDARVKIPNRVLLLL